MKKILFILVVASTLTQVAYSQKAVLDITCMETLIANHKVQHTSFSKVKENEAQISLIQKQISEKMVQIEFFQSKFYNSLKSVEAIIKTGKDIIYCTDIAADIGKYQKQMVELAVGDPALLLVSAKTELELVNRTADLTQYIYQVAIVGTDVNLMDNKQRIDLLKYVINELRNMRGIAYAVCRQMKTAKRNGVLQTLAPGVFKYNVYSQMPVRDKGKWSVLNNMEFMDRVRLQPEWYHYWIWYKKVLGIKIPLPGLGLHDKYGKEDRRNFQLQEIPMMAAVEYNKSETEKEGYNVDTIYRQELFKFGDKEIDYQYTLTKNRRNDILNDINKKLVEYSSNGGNKEHVEVITDEVTRIKKNIDIIHDSHMSNSKKREAYLDFDKELIEVLSLITRLNNINKTIMSHE